MSGHAPHEHGEGNKTVALIIAILALMLAVSEIFGQKAQTHTLQSNIEASNLWAFYQAKTIRKTVTEGFADEVELVQLGVTDPAPAGTANVELKVSGQPIASEVTSTLERQRVWPP